MNTIYRYLEALKNIKTSFNTEALLEINHHISTIVTHCNCYYSDQAFYGNAALNRKILLDPVVAEHLTPEVIQFLMSNPTDNTQVLQRKTTNEVVKTTLKETILSALGEGLLTIKLLPNNEFNYDLAAYEAQKHAFDTSFKKILNALQIAVGNGSILDTLESDNTPILNRFGWVLEAIDTIKASPLSDKILFVPGYSPQDIQEQVDRGFAKICEILKIESLQHITLDDFCEKFITHPDVLLNGTVSHLFYDRLHLTAALEAETKLYFSDGTTSTFRNLFQTIFNKIQVEPERYALAKEQLSLRLSMIEKTFRTQFPQEMKLQDIKNMTPDHNGNRKSYDINEKYQMVQGPLPKSIFTVQLEKIASKLLESRKEVKTVSVNNDIFLIFERDNEIYNLTDILANANFEHIVLNDKCYTLYQQMMETETECEIKTSQNFSDRIKDLPDEQKAIYGRLNLAEAQSINYYTHELLPLSGYRLINDLLRNNLPSIEYASIGVIHAVMLGSAIQKMGQLKREINEELLAHRYFNNYGVDFKALAEEYAVLPVQGFVSVSQRVRYAYAQRMNIKMKVSDVKGYLIAPLSFDKSENEILMPPTQLQITAYQPIKPGMQYTQITASAVSDLYSYSSRSQSLIDDISILNYQKITAIFNLLDSNDMVVKNLSSILIPIYQVIKEGASPELTDDVFNAIIDALNHYRQGKVDAAFLSETIIIKLSTVLNSEHLDLALQCYLKQPGIFKWLNKITQEDLVNRKLVTEGLLFQELNDKAGKQSISERLVAAAIAGKWVTVAQICEFTDEEKTPSREVICEVLKEAVKANKGDIISLLCYLPNNNQPEKNSVSNALIDCTKLYQWSSALRLYELTGSNRPSQDSIDYMLQKMLISSTAENYISFLCSYPNPKKIISNALLAIVNMTGDVSNYCNNEKTLEKVNKILKHICHLKGIYAPTQIVVSEALEKAWKDKSRRHNDAKKLLLEITGDNQPQITESFIQSNSTMELFDTLILCQLSTDTQETAHRMMELATSKQNWILVSHLAELTGSNQPSKEKVKTAIYKAIAELLIEVLGYITGDKSLLAILVEILSNSSLNKELIQELLSQIPEEEETDNKPLKKVITILIERIHHLRHLGFDCGKTNTILEGVFEEASKYFPYSQDNFSSSLFSNMRKASLIFEQIFKSEMGQQFIQEKPYDDLLLLKNHIEELQKRQRYSLVPFEFIISRLDKMILDKNEASHLPGIR